MRSCTFGYTFLSIRWRSGETILRYTRQGVGGQQSGWTAVKVRILSLPPSSKRARKREKQGHCDAESATASEKTQRGCANNFGQFDRNENLCLAYPPVKPQKFFWKNTVPPSYLARKTKFRDFRRSFKRIPENVGGLTNSQIYV